MKYAYYPGCSLHSTAREYDSSLLPVCRMLGMELDELRHWVCCGSSAIYAAPWRLSLAIAFKNMAQVEKQGMSEMMIPCPACLSKFKRARYETTRQPEWRQKLETIVGHKFKRDIVVRHPLEVMSGEGMLAEVRRLVKVKLSGLKLVCYYGCLLTRPPEVTGAEDAEYPQSMDRLMRSLDATVMEWGNRTDCCGASFALTRTDIVRKLSHDILEGARQVGAQAIVVACPLCQLNLDARQTEVEKEYGASYNIPIFYFTELMGIALGIPGRNLLLERHFVDGVPALKGVGIL